MMWSCESTARQVVNVYEQQVVEVWEVVEVGEVGQDRRRRPQPPEPPQTSLTCLSSYPTVDEHPLIAVFALHDGRGALGADARGVHQIVGCENADRDRPLQGRDGLVERAADRVVVCEQARGFARPQEEMRQGIGAIFEGTGLARGCGNGHCDIITMACGAPR